MRGDGVAAGGAQARDVPVVELDVPRVVGGEGHADLGLEHLVGALEDVRSSHKLYSVDFSQSRIGVKKVRLQQTHNQGLRQLL